jgi:hypothetical protein
MRDTADVTGGKPIAVLLQSISGVSAINPLFVLYDIHGKREVLLKIELKIENILILTGLISPLLPTHCVSSVARINSVIPLIDNEQ